MFVVSGYDGEGFRASSEFGRSRIKSDLIAHEGGRD